MNIQGIKGHQNQLNYLSHLKTGGAIPHALLFTGQHGTGKRLIAERFAASVLCREEDSPCFKCAACMQMKAGSYPDYIILERDEKGKIPVGSSDRSQPGSVRWMIERLTRSSINGKYFVVVDGVETISEAGQNALLKTIEEPGADSHIILIAESKSGILPTIVSRCIEINFNPLSVSQINEIMRERFSDGGNSDIIASICGGSVDTALRLNDEKVFNSIMSLCKEISSQIKGGSGELKFQDFASGEDNIFILNVLINIYSFMLKEHIKGSGFSIPEYLLIDADDAEKVVKILLAIKKGLKNNLNVKVFLKGMLSSISELKRTGFPEPDFSWL